MKHQSSPRSARSPRPSSGQGSKRDRVPLPRDLVPIIKTIRRIQEEEDVSEVQALIWRRIQEKLRRDDPETQRSPVAVTCMADLFDVVVRKDVPFIARHIQRFGVPSSDVADITQQVLVAVYRSRSQYEPLRGKRRTWLYRVAFYQSMAYRGSARHRREKLEGLHPDEAALGPLVGKGDPEKQAIANEERQLVWQSIERIPLCRRAVFVAYEIEEWTMEEIAQALGIPKSTCWSRLQRARQEFRRALLQRLRARKASASR